ncbi:hypothetical protein ACHAXT_011743 [Thalassiosira profunda]
MHLRPISTTQAVSVKPAAPAVDDGPRVAQKKVKKEKRGPSQSKLRAEQKHGAKLTELMTLAIDAPYRSPPPASKEEMERRYNVGRNYVIGSWERHNELMHDLAVKMRMKRYALRMLPKPGELGDATVEGESVHGRWRDEAYKINDDWGPPEHRRIPMLTPPIEGFDYRQKMEVAPDTKSLYTLEVGGKPFALDSEDVEKLGSLFLSTLVDPESNFAQPEDGIYPVEADAACFAAFLFFGRFGVLPSLTLEKSYLLDQADFWGLRGKISAELDKQSQERAATKKELEEKHEKKLRQYAKVAIELDSAKKHHNHRFDDRFGRVCCTSCPYSTQDPKKIVMTDKYGNAMADKDGNVIFATSSRSSRVLKCDCKRCNKTIKYRGGSDYLGWCHKCSLCDDCQDSHFSECPNDATWQRVSPKPKTTAQLQAELKSLVEEKEEDLGDYLLELDSMLRI